MGTVTNAKMTGPGIAGTATISGKWGNDLLEVTKGIPNDIDAVQGYAITNGGTGASHPPIGNYTCLNGTGNKKRFKQG